MSPLTLLAAILLPGCGADDPPPASDGESSVRVVDAAGAELVLPHPAQRVVSLVPSATATLRAMGAEGLLVGRTDFDSGDWVSELPSVGGGLEPDLESIVALEPDLVIRFAGEQDPRTPRRLRDLGIPSLAVRPDRLEDIYATAALLGTVTGREAAAEALIDRIRADLDDLVRRTSAWPRQDVAYVLGGSPPWVSGPGTYIAEVMALVGGDNVFDDLGPLYSAVSLEELRTRHIDVVFVSAAAGSAGFDASVTPGARVEEIGDALEIPGPGVVEAARRLAEILHGRPVS